MKTNLNQIAKELHESAIKKGFWDEKREVGTQLMLIVSELSEALEADRKNHHAKMDRLNTGIAFGDLFETFIKDSFEDEIADTFIRLFDLAGHLGIDIDKHIKLKMKYNQTREYKHGKSY